MVIVSNPIPCPHKPGYNYVLTPPPSYPVDQCRPVLRKDKAHDSPLFVRLLLCLQGSLLEELVVHQQQGRILLPRHRRLRRDPAIVVESLCFVSNATHKKSKGNSDNIIGTELKDN